VQIPVIRDARAAYQTLAAIFASTPPSDYSDRQFNARRDKPCSIGNPTSWYGISPCVEDRLRCPAVPTIRTRQVLGSRSIAPRPRKFAEIGPSFNADQTPLATVPVGTSDEATSRKAGGNPRNVAEQVEEPRRAEQPTVKRP